MAQSGQARAGTAGHRPVWPDGDGMAANGHRTHGRVRQVGDVHRGAAVRAHPRHRRAGSERPYVAIRRHLDARHIGRLSNDAWSAAQDDLREGERPAADGNVHQQRTDSRFRTRQL